jgi:hypothetical protein
MSIAPITDNPAKDMATVMAKARAYPDSRLADVLAGKDMSIPQYVAMAEAMGRRDLRNRIDGQQAQQQAQQPSVKEQLLAEQRAPQMAAGIDQLPAPNMEPVGLAGGGIIAFEDGGKVQHFYDQGLVEAQQKEDQKVLAETAKKLGLSVADVLTMVPRAGAGILNAGPIRSLRAAGVNLPYIPDVAGGDFSSKTPFYDKYIRQKETDAATARALEKPLGDQPGDYPVLPGQDAQKTTPPAAPPAGAAAPKSLIDVSQPTAFERRASPFGEMSAEKVDVEGLKSRGLGEGLMRLSAGLMSAPGAKGFSAGIAGLAEQAGLTRKETNALKKDARDYDLNLKRAEAAFEQGQDELGLKFTDAANLNKFRMASLAQEPGELRTIRAALKEPEIAKLLKGRNTAVVSRTDALKEWNDLAPGDKRKLQGMGVSDFNSYYSYLSTGLPGLAVVDTLGKGDKVRS